MNHTFKPNFSEEKHEKNIAMVSAVLENGQILELVYQPEEKKTGFAVWKDNNWSFIKEYQLNEFQRLFPYSPNNNLISNEVVLLPSQPEEYQSEEELLLEIQSFIHRYVDISPLFEKISSYYVLFSWIYDSFNELPYLRLRGEPGSGKTRFLLIVGSLCYKPIFASGASSVSPLFRILNAFRGTLVIDESDFRMSDERAELVKILNNGNVRGFPVLRSEIIGNTKEFNPRAYQVFGPKLIATRGFFDDRALESRFLTEEMGQSRLREDIPISLPDKYKTEALHIRNKLLLFRFRNLHKKMPQDSLVDRTIEPRLNQIFVPLLSIIEDSATQTDLRELARTYNRQMVTERGMDMEAQILEVIKELSFSPETKFSVKEITDSFNNRYAEDYDRKITTKWIGNIIRNKLSLKTQKSHGNFIIPPEEQPKLQRLYERYGLTDLSEKASAQPSLEPNPPCPHSPPYLLSNG
jgi:hypothetical protein